MTSKHGNSPPLDLRQGAAAVICGAALLLGVWLFFRYALGICLPFLLAWLLSRPVKPMAEALHRRTRLPRSLWAAVLVVLTVGGSVALLVAGVRRGLRELGDLASGLLADSGGLASAVEGVFLKAGSLSSRIPFLRSLEDSPGYAELCARIDGMVEAGAVKLAEALTARLPSAAMSVAEFVPAAFVFLTVTLLSCYYFAADDGRIGRGLGQFILRLCPRGVREHVPPLWRRLRRMGRRYLRACLLLGLFTFLQMFIGLAILSVPYAFLLSLLIAVVDFLPLLGTGIILIPWAAVSLLMGEVRLGIGLLVLYAVSSVVRQILEPRLIGQGLGLHPLLSLFAMYAGLRLLGVPGMILAPLLVSAAREAGGGKGEERENASGLAP